MNVGLLTSNDKVSRIGQNVGSIGIGDRSVVAKMEKKKLVFRYIPSEKDYTPQQLEDYKIKEEQLINYVMEHLLHEKAL